MCKWHKKIPQIAGFFYANNAFLARILIVPFQLKYTPV